MTFTQAKSPAGSERRPYTVVVTGAAGFLGWHLRARLLTQPDVRVHAIDREAFHTQALVDAVAEADAVFHCAGINRGADRDLEDGNTDLARRLVLALETTVPRRLASGLREPAVVYAGSNYANDDHPGTDSPYGRGKRNAGEHLLAWGEHAGGGASVADLRFPGLFGEHGRPEYNSFVANFAHAVANGRSPDVVGDRELPLLPVGEAVDRMLAAAYSRTHGVQFQEGTPMLISDVARTLQGFYETYAPAGEIPDLTGPLAVPLFNTLRAAMFPGQYPIVATPRSDQRGSLVEAVRVRGGGGQSFVSTTNPGFTRGNHYHVNKIERFLVLSGTARIALRRVLTDEQVEFTVSGDEPAIIDMPTLWTHNITNVGNTPLVTFFWTNELFDPDRPDTWPLDVDSPAETHKDSQGSPQRSIA